MSNSPKKESMVPKEARPEQDTDESKSYTVSNPTALDQINISIKFKSRDDFAGNVGTSVKHGTFTCTDRWSQAPNPADQKYVTGSNSRASRTGSPVGGAPKLPRKPWREPKFLKLRVRNALAHEDLSVCCF
jgi:hypothetical protein